jgi:hypothetical protein
MAVSVHELARTARLIRLRVEWGMEWTRNFYEFDPGPGGTWG